MPMVWLLAGLGLLIVGAEWLVRGASRIAAGFGVPSLIIGLTVVAFGTSAPELAVSVSSSLAGNSDVALGNVVGSNILNVLLILGLSALICPLVVSRQLVRLDVPLMIAASIAVFLMGLDGRIGRVDGAILFSAILVYIGFLIYKEYARRGGEKRGAGSDLPEQVDQGAFSKAMDSAAPTTSTRSTNAPALTTLPGGFWAGWLLPALLTAAGLALLVLGSRWLVTGAVTIARSLGVSDLIIGLTLVAAGTSLPEVATSIIAAVRGERDIAVGNAVGSNLFNLLAVLGAAAFVAPDGIAVSSAALRFDIPVMIAVAVACLPIFFTGHVIARWEGGLFLAYYGAYLAYLILAAAQHDHLPVFSSVLMFFVIPLTAITLIASLARALRPKAR